MSKYLVCYYSTFKQAKIGKHQLERNKAMKKLLSDETLKKIYSFVTTKQQCEINITDQLFFVIDFNNQAILLDRTTKIPNAIWLGSIDNPNRVFNNYYETVIKILKQKAVIQCQPQLM